MKLDDILKYLNSHLYEHDIVHKKCNEELARKHKGCWRLNRTMETILIGFTAGFFMFGLWEFIALNSTNSKLDVIIGHLDTQVRRLYNADLKLEELYNAEKARLVGYIDNHERKTYWDGHGKIPEFRTYHDSSQLYSR